MYANGYTLNIDIKKDVGNIIPVFVAYDTATLYINVTDNGKPFDLSAADKITFELERPDKLIVSGVGSLENGMLKYTLGATEMEITGTVTVIAQFYSLNTRISTKPFKIKITGDLQPDVASSDALPLIQQLQSDGAYARGQGNALGQKGTYSSTATYNVNNIVTFNNINYICIQNTTAGIDPSNGAYWTQLSPLSRYNSQKWTASANQTVFTISNGSYVTGSNSIQVFVGGLEKITGTDYTETNSTSFTLATGVSAGTVVSARWTEGAASISKTHHDTHQAGGQDELDVTLLKNYPEQIANKIGILSNLTTAAKSDLVSAISENQGKISTNTSNIGTLANLQTTDKSSLVNSINETTTSITSIQTSVNRMNYYILPEAFGATGDGVSDDTAALNAAIASATNGKGILSLKPHAQYLVTSTIKVPDYISIEGNNALIKVAGVWNTVSMGASVPTTTILFVKGREPVQGTDLTMSTRFIKDLQIDGGTQSSPYTGMYLGTPDNTVITQSTSVNYAVYQCTFSNISISNVAEGVFAAEVWGSQFSNVNTSYIGDCGLKIQGQIVNNTFTACQWSGLNNAVYVDGATYNGSIRRPEGCVFQGGFIGGAKWGVNIVRCLAFRFSNVIIDLNNIFAVTGQDMSDVQFDHCWIYCSGRAIDIQAISAQSNGTFVNFTGCNISQDAGGDPYLVYIHIRQNGINFQGCKFNGVVYWDDGACGCMENNFWDGTPDANTRIQKHGTGVMNQTRNMFKQDGSAVTYTNA